MSTNAGDTSGPGVAASSGAKPLPAALSRSARRFQGAGMSANARMDWTQAICRDCWNERNPERQVTNAATVLVGDVCSYCGHAATSGIYVRDDPSTVPFPQPVRG